MEYVVKISVESTEANGNESTRTLTERWSFGDNFRYFLAGEANVVLNTAREMVSRIQSEARGGLVPTFLEENQPKPRKI